MKSTIENPTINSAYSRLLLFACACICSQLLSANAATVTTDQADYSPGPSSGGSGSVGTQPGSSFSFSFPSSVTVSGTTYNLNSTSKTSPFLTGAGGSTTTVTGTYALACTAPVVTCSSSLANGSAGASCQAAIPNVTGLVSVSGPCSPVITGQSPAAGTMVGLGPHTITVTAQNSAGQIGRCQATFTVVDTTPPVTPTLADVTGQCSATATTPTTTEKGAGTVTGTTSNPWTYNTQGTHVIHWTFSDGNGNSTTANQNVIIHDTTPPVTPTLANVTGQCSATATTPTDRKSVA